MGGRKYLFKRNVCGFFFPKKEKGKKASEQIEPESILAKEYAIVCALRVQMPKPLFSLEKY